MPVKYAFHVINIVSRPALPSLSNHDCGHGCCSEASAWNQNSSNVDAQSLSTTTRRANKSKYPAQCDIANREHVHIKWTISFSATFADDVSPVCVRQHYVSWWTTETAKALSPKAGHPISQRSAVKDTLHILWFYVHTLPVTDTLTRNCLPIRHVLLAHWFRFRLAVWRPRYEYAWIFLVTVIPEANVKNGDYL